jgi:hypothetical protein
MADLIQVVGRALVVHVEPVLIAPHGGAYHVARAVVFTEAGKVGHVLEAKCGTVGPAWIAVDQLLAEALQRSRCERCHPYDRGEQLAVSDLDPEEVR